MSKVTFSNGVTVNMHYPPPFPLNESLKRLAQYKIMPGDSDDVVIEKQIALGDARERYALKTAFRDLVMVIPDDWEFPAAALSEGLEPTDGGEQGRLFDYVRHEFIRTPEDVEKVNAVMMYSSPVTREEVDAARTLFQRLRNLRIFNRRKTSTQSA